MAAVLPEEPQALSTRYMAWYRFTRNPAAVIGALMVASVVITAIFAPLIAPFPDHVGAVVDFRHRHQPRLREAPCHST